MNVAINNDVIRVNVKSQSDSYSALGYYTDTYSQNINYPVTFNINTSEYKDYVPAIAIKTDSEFNANDNSFIQHIGDLQGGELSYRNITSISRCFRWYLHTRRILWNGLMGIKLPSTDYRNGVDTQKYFQNNINEGKYELLFAIMIKREDVEYYKDCVKYRVEPDYSIFEFWADDNIATSLYATDSWSRIKSTLEELEIPIKIGNFNNLLGILKLDIPKTPTKRKIIASKILDFLENKRVEENGGKKVLIQSSDTKVSDESNAIQEQEASLLL